MLVRCKHCGSVLPEEATKCFVCGNKHTPPPPPEPEPINHVLEQRKKLWLNIGWIIDFIAITLGLVGVIMLAAGIAIISESATISARTGLTIALCGGGCSVLCALMFVFIVRFEKTIRPKPTSNKHKVDEAEYRQRIHNFINR